MADIKNFGIKGLAADVQLGKSGGRLKYDSANSRFDLTQSDGSTLENIRVGSIVAGAWTADAIDPQYGGTGQDFSGSTGIVAFSNGVASATTLDLSNASFVSGELSVANGGTGASTASGARTNLGLGSIATQDSDNVALTGGSVDGVVIGGSTAAAGSFTTLAASGGITGDLTGTASNALVLTNTRDIGLSGDATGNVSFNGSADVNLALTLAASGVTAGVYGDSTNIPQLTVDSKGRVTSVSNISISTAFDIAGDNGSSDTVSGGETLTFAGTSGQIETTITDNNVEIGIIDGASVANLSVTGTFTSDDITSAQISIDGDATITGNLTVNGTQTIVNSTVVNIDDAIVRVNSDGASQSAGLEANIGGVTESVVFNPVTSRWEFSDDIYTADNIEFGGLTDGTTTITQILDEATLASNAADALPTQQSVKSYVDNSIDALELAYTDDASTGSLSVDLSSQTLQIAGDGTAISTSGSGQTLTVSLDNTAVTAGSYGNSTSIATFTVDAQGRITAAGTADISTNTGIAGDTGTDTVAGGETITFAGTANEIETAVTNNQVQVGLVDSPTVSGTFTAGNVTTAGTVEGGSVTDGTATLASGSLTGAVGVTASGTIEGGTLTDGTASLSSGSITSAVNGTFSGVVTGGSLTDGTATLSSGALSGATTGSFSGNVSAANFSGGDVDATGAVSFGTLTDGSIVITGIVDEDNMASDSDTLIPTQQSVKAYVDTQLTGQDLDFQGDTGGALSIDLDSEVMTIAGGTGIETAGATNTLTVTLSDTAVTAGNYGAADTVATFTVNAQGQLTAAADTTINITASQVNDFNTAINAHLVGGTGIDYTTGTIDLADTAVTAGDYGSATQIPTFTVDAQGRITAASNVSVSTGFDIAGDNGSNDTVSGGETLTFAGTASQIETTITDNNVEIGIVDGASIANLSVTGTFTSDDITSAAISIDGDATITGNLTVQGTQTIVESTTVQTADAIFRTNSNGSAADAGFEANTSNGVKQILYTTVGQEWDFGTENVKASTFTGDLVGNADSATALETARTFSASGDATATGVSFDGTANVDLALTLATVNSDVGTHGNATLIPSITVNAKGLITAVTTNAVASDLNITGDSGSDAVSLLSDTLNFAGGTNITTTVSNNDVSVALDSNISLTSVTADTFTGDLTGNVTFSSLTDGTTSVTDIETAITDVDTAVPTSGAVVDYVANNGGDGLLLRGAFTADSSASSFDVGTMPNVSSRTYYANKVVIKVGTAFSGGSFNAIKVQDNGGSGSVVVDIDDADAATAGTYVVELDGELALTKNAAITVNFLQSDGTTASVPTAGAMTATVHYNWV